MSGVVEYRIERAKSMVGYAMAMILDLFALLMWSMDEYLVAAVLLVFAIVFLVVLKGKSCGGRWRILAKLITRNDYSHPPTNDWQSDLEERGEL